MDVSKLAYRVSIWYTPDEVQPPDDVITEALQRVHDRIAIRLKFAEVPDAAASIVVDAAMKLLRLRGYEGMERESIGDGGTISNDFVDNVLEEYELEIQALYAAVHRPQSTSGPKVRFL